MEDAVAQGKDELVHRKLPPSSFEPFQGAVDTSVAVVTNIKSLTTTWRPFLQKLKLFTKLADGIAHVSGRTDGLSAVYEVIECPGPPIRSYGVEHPLCCKQGSFFGHSTHSF